ncbi:MAG TPA: hypothetical protein VN455_04060 [Methanotrichaceae archaeon]|nr:hypothetical protein [Methanotrichaceae archaeon]
MCEGMGSRGIRRPPHKRPQGLEEQEEEEALESFKNLSAQAISELVKDEPDTYTIEDVKIRYK